ncbi:MAG: hypothetical protein COS68_01985 [Elusimicrobia bacterium CG06_land_8_20_14_3_00_38_11]|nr:MAG: hypothetical protein COS68_01985 [Elusimicrobia bacterium CG06_land_8_20_14_3_00_38_11]
MIAFIFRDKLITLGIAGGAVLGCLNIFATFFTTKNLSLKTYFIRTTIKFAVIIALFYILLKLKANVFALLSGFTIPLIFMAIEAIRCRLLKKQ